MPSVHLTRQMDYLCTRHVVLLFHLLTVDRASSTVRRRRAKMRSNVACLSLALGLDLSSIRGAVSAWSLVGVGSVVCGSVGQHRLGPFHRRRRPSPFITVELSWSVRRGRLRHTLLASRPAGIRHRAARHLHPIKDPLNSRWSVITLPAPHDPPSSPDNWTFLRTSRRRQHSVRACTYRNKTVIENRVRFLGVQFLWQLLTSSLQLWCVCSVGIYDLDSEFIIS